MILYSVCEKRMYCSAQVNTEHPGLRWKLSNEYSSKYIAALSRRNARK